jgi:hypothetical protein
MLLSLKKVNSPAHRTMVTTHASSPRKGMKVLLPARRPQTSGTSTLETGAFRMSNAFSEGDILWIYGRWGELSAILFTFI